MIFLLVILTFAAGIGISALHEARAKQAQKPRRVALELTPCPALVQITGASVRHAEAKTGQLTVGPRRRLTIR